MDMLSASDNMSMPVSPEAGFGGGGLLPQADFIAPTVPSLNSAFSSQQPPYFNGTDAAARPTPSAGATLGENKWFQTATGTALQSPPGTLPSPVQDNSSFGTPPPGYDMAGQMPGGLGHTLLGPPGETGYPRPFEMESCFAGEQSDRREEYIRQLEAENRYLRTCLIQCMGPNAAAMSLLPPPPGGPPSQGFFRLPDGLSIPDVSDTPVGPLPFGQCPPPPPGVPAPMPSSVQGASAPPMTTTSNGLCPNAPPFWPAWQEPSDMREQVADADGNLVSTSNVGQLLAGE
jgi:hypothetical protein